VLRRHVWYTPETILLEGLRRLGHETAAFSHYQPVRMSDFDIIHVHHLSFGAMRAACGASRTPFVFTVHSTKRKDTWIREKALRFVFRRADAVVSLSAAELKSDAAAYHLRRAIHRTIFNGIDSRVYSFAPKLRDTSHTWSILCVAHLTPLKGHETLLRALVRLPIEFELNLVYQGETLLCELRRLATELGIAGRVKFLGPKNPNELRRLYQQADVFVLGSFGEALPSVVSEAMMCGTPVVATDVGGVREQVGADGIVVPPRDIDALAAGIGQVIADYPAWIGRAEEISSRARERFSINAMLQRHLELYREVIDRGTCVRRSVAALPANIAAGVATGLADIFHGNPHMPEGRA
jgi:glycosyltransferase involved in cell wall biosynthesis